MEPPHTPLRPAAAVTGTRASLHAASTAATCSVVARRDHGGRALGDAALGRPADGERPPVAPGLGPGGVVGVHVGAGRREALEQRGVGTSTARAPRRSATSSGAASIGVTGVGVVTAGRARPVEELLLARLGEARRLLRPPPPRSSPARGR